MKVFDSLAARLVFALLAATVAVAVIAAAAGSITMHREINETMDAALRESARRLVPLVVDDLYGRDSSQTARTLAVTDFDDDSDPLIYQVRSERGDILLRSHGAPAAPLTETLEQGFQDGSDWRIYTEPAISGAIFIQVAESHARRNEETLEAATGFLVPLALLTPLGALAAWLLLRRFLRPVNVLRHEIGDRHGSNLEPIGLDGLPSELAAIADSVNGLMRRLNLALAAEKEFTANAAHELRTPVAGALAQAERLIAETSDRGAKLRARKIGAALANLSRLSEKLLQLARADAGVVLSSDRIDLAPVVLAVVDEFRSHQDSQVDIHVEVADAVRAAVNQDALAIMLRNLIENALHYGDRAKPVIVRIESLPNHDARLRVINEGPAVPAGTLVGLTTRFQRGSAAVPGSGLGLAIVSRIASQLDAKIMLKSPATGCADGFEAIIDFPISLPR